jgi:hypothetical protein
MTMMTMMTMMMVVMVKNDSSLIKSSAPESMSETQKQLVLEIEKYAQRLQQLRDQVCFH